jgi:tRNA(Ile)-lysidine synthase
MRLLRGSRPEALAVLPACSERRLRPFIRSPLRAISSHLLRHGIAYAEDPSNRDRRFLRARVRHELLPLMFDINPRIVDHLNQLADELAEPAEICVTDDQGLPVPVRLGHRTQIRRALKLGQRHARIRLPGGLEVRMDTVRTAAGLRAVPRAAQRAAEPKAAAALENAEVGRENTSPRRAKPVKSD